MIALFFVSSVAVAQNRNMRPPAMVQRSFSRDNRNSNNVNWSQSNGNWHATYQDRNNRQAEVYYDRNGRRIATHWDINRNEAPRQVDQRVYTMYHTHDYRIRRIERPSQPTLFQVLVNGLAIYLDAQGRKTTYTPRY